MAPAFSSSLKLINTGVPGMFLEKGFLPVFYAAFLPGNNPGILFNNTQQFVLISL